MNPKPDKLMPSLYGGLLIATIVTVPGLNLINGFCCAGIIVGGFLSVVLYQRKITAETSPLILNDCLQLGLYSGIISSFISALISFLVEIFFGKVQIELMMELVTKFAQQANAELPQWFYEAMDEAMKATPNALSAVLTGFIQVVPFSIFSILGALIGWNVFKPKS